MTQLKPTVLCILDGWGLRPETKGNAVALASTPCFDRLMAENPASTLITYGPDVGLPNGQMGNSEVGHMNIGAGRVVEMDLRKIEGAIERGEFATLPAITRFVDALRDSNGVAHLCGVLSDGGVHSHIDHMIAAARALSDAGLEVKLHLFGDGRDVAPKSALGYLKDLEAVLGERVSVASLSGRYFALDRDNRWDRVAQAYGAVVNATGPRSDTAEAVINAAYAEDVTDEFIPPTVLGDYQGIKDGDGLLFLNFRADRAREILAAIGDPDFDGFETGPRPSLAILSGFAQYSDRHGTYMDCVFPKEKITNTLGAWVAAQGKKQFRIAETEKYPHVTFFLNGGVEVPAADEVRYLAPSPKVATYDLQPEMSSEEVTENLLAAIDSDEYDLIVVNYANPDMVGHTGDLAAAMAACSAVDAGVAQVVEKVNAKGGAMLICADHGNCETMIDPETGGPHTAHTTNPVPVILVGGPEGAGLRDGGRLADLAPSLLELMGLTSPPEMTGKSLLT
ncbi:2,3-bisphosphoglycerate-independent phosphoglycerate mutase [Amylibacter marinus]|uniref:2,3-bisphosphoglycerate-independent phosphoglycerate mutase n=1 Tax=Amylibacter marinus TaxID=1475483 RepID=A0ABQ5VVU7_9RHOB|nr:2,3-bisphosphoglycerate-independent phosphoglycerate mutase [Amylibacter marinus]GLQ35395.1 2,3-bisphosphoglycerate-independent phosphoglycerate mutase [Amylibacter marinus]